MKDSTKHPVQTDGQRNPSSQDDGTRQQPPPLYRPPDSSRLCQRPSQSLVPLPTNYGSPQNHSKPVPRIGPPRRLKLPVPGSRRRPTGCLVPRPLSSPRRSPALIVPTALLSVSAAVSYSKDSKSPNMTKDSRQFSDSAKPDTGSFNEMSHPSGQSTSTKVPDTASKPSPIANLKISQNVDGIPSADRDFTGNQLSTQELHAKRVHLEPFQTPSVQKYHSLHDSTERTRTPLRSLINYQLPLYHQSQAKDLSSQLSTSIKPNKENTKQHTQELKCHLGVAPFPPLALATDKVSPIERYPLSKMTLLQLLSCPVPDKFDTYRENGKETVTMADITTSPNFPFTDVNMQLSTWEDFQYEKMVTDFPVLGNFVAVPKHIG